MRVNVPRGNNSKEDKRVTFYFVPNEDTPSICVGLDTIPIDH